MDGNSFFFNGYQCDNMLHQVQAQNKPINDICNIKLGKKYLFKTVQSPSTQSKHINRYSVASAFGSWGQKRFHVKYNGIRINITLQ